MTRYNNCYSIRAVAGEAKKKKKGGGGEWEPRLVVNTVMF
jgi:hypothetical protein